MFSKGGRTGAKTGAGAAGFAKVRAAAKIAGAAGAGGGMESTMQPRAPGGLVEGGAGTRASVGGEDGAPGKDKKKAQVKDFYSNLLNKSKGAGAKKKPVEK